MVQPKKACKSGCETIPLGLLRQQVVNLHQVEGKGAQAYSGHGLYLIYRGCPDNPAGAILGSMTKISLPSP